MCKKKNEDEAQYVHRIYLRRAILLALIFFCILYFGATVAMLMYF